MRDQIVKELKHLEKKHDIKILYAVESGSRAWGFASTDSDWDVRFIYVHNPDWYLSIDNSSDSIDLILPNDIDLSGWELRKALKLFRKSNPPLFEWLRSPIVYLENYSTAERLRRLNSVFFNPKSCLYHYLHMAESNFKEYLQKDSVRVKKYFYVLTPILACQWIEQKNTMAPMEFRQLVDTQITDGQIKDVVENLLSRKMLGEELNEEPKIEILNDFLIERLSYFKGLMKNIDTATKPETSLLNMLFRETLQEAYESKHVAPNE